LNQRRFLFNLFHSRRLRLLISKKALMLEPKTDAEPPQPPLPLFRPEVLAARGQKLYGEILLIRPLSSALFAWLGIVLATALLVLLFGQHRGKPLYRWLFEHHSASSVSTLKPAAPVDQTSHNPRDSSHAEAASK